MQMALLNRGTAKKQKHVFVYVRRGRRSRGSEEVKITRFLKGSPVAVRSERHTIKKKSNDLAPKTERNLDKV